MSAGAPVLIMAGGTGGHIFPGLAVAEELRLRGIPVLWMGAAGGLETQLVPKAGIAIETLDIGGVRGKGLATKLKAPLRLARAVLAARRALRRTRPRSVLSLGGFAAGPGGLAAWLSGTPLLVHEQNRIPGATNRVLARLARRVLAGFADAFPQAQKSIWVGNPVRAAIAAIAAPAQRLAGRSAAPHLLVLGGSLGAQALNTRLPEAIAGLAVHERPQLRHQCGPRHADAARAAYAAAGVEASVEPFIDDMAAAYAWADLIVCRAGALTLAEIAAAGCAAVLVPYPHAVDDHQTRNADAFVAAGAALRLAETEATPTRLHEELHRLLNDRPRLLAMAEAARSLAKPDAAQQIADHCLQVAA
ncbi:UDP-N-acetylglucosamine-N-acetylmuramylpentapeptide N-acetylglucosamine transferase [Tahibacter aquaticus]|uniref:UDP-N-acetylglucosamine--N-acetylmuramyl-(pentapeptide) pyrophosphoryl-undecaprenol N-acetylglucosamine transferase n=1 Tax=Tahibacter aquaticus TaxID=520092 RepID=A0A4V3DNK3_9GAMM|nr:undecaprenyldiphospho-muramoylpentapeptide beta-N-acetylglucosaminyltransferase [Tahibacter aquaticus]TDR48726.1 UDP-N-acetylglucosamine-N-acetylmuramylpentapeptide N-acetylglucosamine transferase [Tahibacter aquaticus]